MQPDRDSCPVRTLKDPPEPRRPPHDKGEPDDDPAAGHRHSPAIAASRVAASAAVVEWVVGAGGSSMWCWFVGFCGSIGIRVVAGSWFFRLWSCATDDDAGRFLGLWVVLGVRVLFRVLVDVDDVWLAVGP